MDQDQSNHILCAPCMLCVARRYEEDEERRERFYYTMLGGGGTPPVSACPDVARLVVQQHFNCPSAWCILPLQVCCMLSLQPLLGRRNIYTYMNLFAGP